MFCAESSKRFDIMCSICQKGTYSNNSYLSTIWLYISNMTWLINVQWVFFCCEKNTKQKDLPILNLCNVTQATQCKKITHDSIPNWHETIIVIVLSFPIVILILDLDVHTFRWVRFHKWAGYISGGTHMSSINLLRVKLGQTVQIQSINYIMSKHYIFLFISLY